MQNTEKQIAIVENVTRDSDTFDLYWMEKRLVAINTRSQVYGGAGIAGYLMSQAITNLQQARRNEKLKGLTLDEILAKDKHSFRIPYSSIKEAKLVNLDSRWKRPMLKIDDGEHYANFSLDKQQVEKLKTILQIINKK